MSRYDVRNFGVYLQVLFLFNQFNYIQLHSFRYYFFIYDNELICDEYELKFQSKVPKVTNVW